MPSAQKKKTSKDQPEPNLRRSARSNNKETEAIKDTMKEPEAAAANTTAKRAPKRKKPDEPAEQANKRPHMSNQVPEGRDSEKTPEKPTSPQEQVIAVKVARKAPQRPLLSLDSGDEDTDGCITGDDASHAESDDEMANLPTATDLIAEYPAAVGVAAGGQSDDGLGVGVKGVIDPRRTVNRLLLEPNPNETVHGGQGRKRSDRILDEVPVLGNPADDGVGDAPAIPIQPATVQPAYTAPLQNTPLLPTPYTIQLPEPVVPLPAPDPLMPAWLPITDLVIGRDSHYQQSDQSPEIQACLSATVRRANANLILLDGFPDPHRKGQWLADALGIELSQRRKASTNIAILDDRARHDAQFFNRLLYMIRGRWSTFRQGAIDMARTIVVSPESSYGLHSSDNIDPSRVPATACNLLLKDSYHFGKTAAGAVDTTAPYQHLEIFVALAHFFKGREAVGALYKESLPTGIHGIQIPDAMLALTATTIQVALEELVTGKRESFSEKACRERYRSHLSTIQLVKADKDRGDKKYARMMSNIYQGTMKYLENGRPTPSSANATEVDLSGMAV